MNATFTANGSSSILMYDPIESQSNALLTQSVLDEARATNNHTILQGTDEVTNVTDPTNLQATLGNLTLNLSKEGTGMWYQGGTSNLRGESHVNINNGTFLLDRDAVFDIHPENSLPSTFLHDCGLDARNRNRSRIRNECSFRDLGQRIHRRAGHETVC